MPIVHITIAPGRSTAQVGDCIRAVARSVADTLEVPLPAIRVIVQEVPDTHLSIGDQLKSDTQG